MYTSVALLSLASLASNVLAQQNYTCDTPLAAKRFDYDALPYQADQCDGERGRQVGYNLCNSTTAGPNSLCQTAIVNSIDDFCLWGPQEPGEVVGNIEGEMVAWCTKGDAHGARQIPAGALTGVQFMKTPSYVQVTGFITQSMIDIAADDDGGELDSAGADNRGNPLGSLMFTNAFGSNSSVNGTGYSQALRWHNFMGANTFCIKVCDPSNENDYRLCEHVYDRSGCGVNAPAAYRNGTFDSCLGDDQLPPGVYVENGATRTWTQPPEGQALGQLPYSVFTPASSQCTTYESAALYTAGAAASASSVSSASSAVPTDSAASSGASSAASGVSQSGARPSSASGAAASQSARPTSGAERILPVGGALAVVGLVAALF